MGIIVSIICEIAFAAGVCRFVIKERLIHTTGFNTKKCLPHDLDYYQIVKSSHKILKARIAE